MRIEDKHKTEGFANGFMFKYKSYYYRYWKNLRGVMMSLWSGKQLEDIERCMEPIHEKLLPQFVENWKRYHSDSAPHIFDYKNFVMSAFSSEIHDIQ